MAGGAAFGIFPVTASLPGLPVFVPHHPSLYHVLMMSVFPVLISCGDVFCRLMFFSPFAFLLRPMEQ